LQARYIRGAFADRPFTLGKYEGTRIRSAIAELAANGGAPMGFYTTFSDPLARAEIVRYSQFLGRHDSIYRGNLPHSEVALLFPRRQVHQAKVGAVESFRKIGQALLDAHVLFDVWLDDMFPAGRAARYARVVTVADSPGTVVAGLPDCRSRFKAPYSVRVSASRPAGTEGELDLHFVNYNRAELPRGPGGQPNFGAGIKDERRLPVSALGADVVLPTGATQVSVRFLSP
jgi:hypothetical protein